MVRRACGRGQQRYFSRAARKAHSDRSVSSSPTKVFSANYVQAVDEVPQPNGALDIERYFGRPPASADPVNTSAHYEQPDFELATWQLLNLCIAPRKV